MASGGVQTLASRRPWSNRLTRLRVSRSENDDFDFSTEVSTIQGLFEETEEDVTEEGKQLFHNFIHDQVCCEEPGAAAEIKVLTPAGYANPMWAKAGRELRHMADMFAQTAERRRVKQKASELNTDITYQEFKDMLSELFASGGVTKERIVVLFFFCSDVAIRSLKSGAELCRQFLSWSISFITDYVCSWVRSRGGWSEVLSSSFNSLPRVLFLAGIIFLGVGVIRHYISR